MDCVFRGEVALQLWIRREPLPWFKLAHRATPQKTFNLSCSSELLGPDPNIRTLNDVSVVVVRCPVLLLIDAPRRYGAVLQHRRRSQRHLDADQPGVYRRSARCGAIAHRQMED